MKIIKISFFVLYFVAFAFHCLFSLQSAQTSSGVSYGLSDLIAKIIEDVFKKEINDFDNFHNIIRKVIGHFAFFRLIGLFGFFTYYLFTESIKYSLIFTLMSGVIMAFTSELLQIFAIDRAPSFIDALIDYSGYLISSIVLSVIVLIAKRQKKKRMRDL